MNMVRGLALPNYLLFLCLCSLAVIAVVKYVRNRWRQLALLGLVYLWIWLEINRWFAAIRTYQDSNSGIAYLGWLFQHLAVDVVSLGTIWLVVRKSRPAPN